MARNQEKAQSMLSRYLRQKRGEARPERRPAFASEVTDLQEAERWRREVLREISREAGLIQDATLGEAKIRELNDHINKLLREKRHWERQIRSLGGPDYSRAAVVADLSAAVQDSNGYVYIGAARELPGVRELLERKFAEDSRRAVTRAELYGMVDAAYYGYRDDDDGLLQRLERDAEERAVRRSEAEWLSTHPEAAGQEEGSAAPVYRAHVELPEQSDIERAVLARKKEALLARLRQSA
jgi:pre-mRNA-splicing factor ISY1